MAYWRNYNKTFKDRKLYYMWEKASFWHGHVIAKEKMALENYTDKKIIAGFCDIHNGKYLSDDNGNYGNYNSELMGECVSLF